MKNRLDPILKVDQKHFKGSRQMPMMLVPLDGSGAIILDKAIIFFGRGAECDIILNTSRKVSRKHCCVAQIDDYFIVRDLGSMNGVRINAELVEGEARLKSGDVLWVGDLGFRFEPASSAAIKAAAPANGQKKKNPIAAKPQRPVDPRLLSQDYPVAIPDEGVSFQVERSLPQGVIPDDEVIELSEGDIIEED